LWNYGAFTYVHVKEEERRTKKEKKKGKEYCQALKDENEVILVQTYTIVIF